MKRTAAFVPVIALSLVAAGFWQQSSKVDFKTSVEKATKNYEAKNYGEALKHLRNATQVVTNARADAIRAALPAAPSGMKVEDTKNQDSNNSFLMGGLGCQVERRYTTENGEKNISLKVQADSTFVGMLLPMLTNPVLVQSQGGEILEYGKNKAVLTKQGDDGKNWKLQIIVDAAHLIEIECTGFDRDGLLKIFDDTAVGKLAKELGN